jgi:tetratricopeptide (TPR) repeat protein
LNQNIINEPNAYAKEIKEAYDIFMKFRDRQEFENLLNKIINEAWAIDDIFEYMGEESRMISNLVDIAIELKEVGESEKSNELIEEVYRVSSEEISDEYWRVFTLIKMYHKLRGKDFKSVINKLKEEISIQNIHDVIDNTGTAWRSNLLKEISIAKYSLENLETTEEVSFEIERMEVRIECWMELAKIILEETGWKKAINQVDNFQNNVPKKFYLKGLANNLSAIECNTQAILNSYRYYLNDIESLGKIFLKYALHETFFGNSSEERIKRFNRTLNIQWAIDIKNQLPN